MWDRSYLCQEASESHSFGKSAASHLGCKLGERSSFAEAKGRVEWDAIILLRLGFACSSPTRKHPLVAGPCSERALQTTPGPRRKLAAGCIAQAQQKPRGLFAALPSQTPICSAPRAWMLPLVIQGQVCRCIQGFSLPLQGKSLSWPPSSWRPLSLRRDDCISFSPPLHRRIVPGGTGRVFIL